MKKLLSIILAATLILVGCSTNNNDTSNELTNLTFVLDWTPNTNHTGLYVAQEKGYFEEEGLNVEIVTPGEAGSNQLIASGKAEFGISAQESLTEARTQGVPIVSIAAIIQHNTSGFASPTEKAINSPKDYEGKTYGGWGAPVEEAVLKTLMNGEQADVAEVDFLNIGSADFFTAVERDIDFAWIYYGWDGIEAERRGIDLNMQYLADFDQDLDFYTPIIATNEKMIEQDPQLIKDFLSALTKGYEYTINEPEEAAKILTKAVPELDDDLVKASQQWLSTKFQDDAARWGEQKNEVWENYSNWMHTHELIEEPLEVEKAFTNEFLPK